MPREIQPFKQPHSYGCLPTCVQAALRDYGEDITYKQASAWCRELPGGGCFWIDAVSGLMAQGYAVEEITTGEESKQEALQKLRQTVREEGSLIIAEVASYAGAGHAVVVTDVEQAGSEEIVYYMDPDRGRYGDNVSLPIDTFFKVWQMRDLKAFAITGE